MEKVEEDLARSKNLREKQAKEFSRQLDDLKIKHEKEVHFFCMSLSYEKRSSCVRTINSEGKARNDYENCSSPQPSGK